MSQVDVYLRQDNLFCSPLRDLISKRAVTYRLAAMPRQFSLEIARFKVSPSRKVRIRFLARVNLNAGDNLMHSLNEPKISSPDVRPASIPSPLPLPVGWYFIASEEVIPGRCGRQSLLYKK